MIVLSVLLVYVLAPNTTVMIPPIKRTNITTSWITSLSLRRKNAMVTVIMGVRLLTTAMMVKGMFLLANELIDCVAVLYAVLRTR